MLLKIVFRLLALLIGLGCLIAGIFQRKYAKEAEAWPTTPGEVISSSWVSPTSGTRSPLGNVSYVDGAASKKIAPYPQCKQVTVLFDPANPLNAVLETKAAGSVIFLANGILFMIIVIIAGVFLFKH